MVSTSSFERRNKILQEGSELLTKGAEVHLETQMHTQPPHTHPACPIPTLTLAKSLSLRGLLTK